MEKTRKSKDKWRNVSFSLLELEQAISTAQLTGREQGTGGGLAVSTTQPTGN